MSTPFPINSEEKIKVIVKSPDGTLFDGQVYALTSINQFGLFDVLPFHSNLVSIIREKLVLYETKDTPKEIKIEKGIVKVSENIVEIFLGVETIG